MAVLATQNTVYTEQAPDVLQEGEILQDGYLNTVRIRKE